MATRSYITLQNDRIDLIAERAYGTERGTTEQIISANRGLAAMPIRLPLGERLELPTQPEPTTPKQVNLWD